MKSLEEVFLAWCRDVLRHATNDIGTNTAPLWHSIEGTAVITEALHALGAMSEVARMPRAVVEEYLCANKNRLLGFVRQRRKAYEERTERAVCDAIVERFIHAPADEQRTLIHALFRARGPLWIDTRNLLRTLGFSDTSIAEQERAFRFDHDQ